jgi:hypothetical protein
MKVKQIIQVLVVLFCVSLNAQKQDSNKQQERSGISLETLVKQKKQCHHHYPPTH